MVEINKWLLRFYLYVRDLLYLNINEVKLTAKIVWQYI